MQLVPDTGARDALAYLTGRPCSLPTAALFRPHLNILLGVAYLEWLWRRLFPQILPDHLRVLVCVAAYNAGPSRIRRWLTNLGPLERTELTTQPPRVERLVQKLTMTLPWGETRRFVRAVTRHWQYYRVWLGSVQPLSDKHATE